MCMHAFVHGCIFVNMYGIRRSIRSLDKTITVVLVIKMKGAEVTPTEKSAAHIMLCWTRSAVCACMLLAIDAYS